MAVEKKPAKATKFKGTLARRLASARIVGLGSLTFRQCRQFYVAYPGKWQALSAELPMPISAMARQLATKPEMTNSITSVDPARLAAKLDAAIAANLKELGDGG